MSDDTRRAVVSRLIMTLGLAFEELAAAFKPVVVAMNRLAAEMLATLRVLPLLYLLSPDEVVRWAIERAGVTEADVRRVDYTREVVVLWNHRRIPIDVMAAVAMVQR